jgi:peptidyl-prolyl cis-trans isomerase SurA
MVLTKPSFAFGCAVQMVYRSEKRATIMPPTIMFKHLLASACFILWFATLSAQSEDAVLFSVKGKPVTVSEFRYIYTKTNQDKADFSEASLRDYLDLYIKFKLKVQKARDMQLDTVAALRSELDGYRRQLANSYLVDKEVTEKLIRETYDRMLQDVNISHIFIACDRNAKAVDSLRAYNRAMNMLKLIDGGISFEKMAQDSSEDKSAKENKGNLGFVTAMLPDGYYTMEKAIYAASKGSVVGPVRSNTGYHLVKVNDFRPARGEVEVAQILVRKDKSPEKNTMQRMRIDSAYALLKSGAKWDDVCARFSEDKVTAPKGGYIGFFGINRYQRTFEDAAFGLEKDNDYAAPIETSLGWHIIKRVSRRSVGTFESTKRALTERVKRDSRSEISKQSMIARIKKESNFREYPEALAKWSARQVDSIFLTFKWKADPAKPQDILMRYNDNTVFTVADFEEYCVKTGRDRMRGIGLPAEETIQRLYKNWSDEVSMQFEESQLDKKYPDFHSLMREYEEGILLFEALKLNVWDKANNDTLGLEQHYNTNLSQKYKWEERARVSIYTLKTDDPKIGEKVRQLAAKKPSVEVLKKMNKKTEVVTVMEKLYEKGKNKDLGAFWSPGAVTSIKADASTKTAFFLKIEELVAPTPKVLAEARGYAVADFQDHLEKQWIDELRKTYPVQVNEAALKSLVKK